MPLARPLKLPLAGLEPRWYDAALGGFSVSASETPDEVDRGGDY